MEALVPLMKSGRAMAPLAPMVLTPMHSDPLRQVPLYAHHWKKLQDTLYILAHVLQCTVHQLQGSVQCIEH